MTPSRIVKRAIEKGLNIIAITDHNSAENVISAKKSAEGTGLIVLAGMEVTSNEEAHVLAIFDDTDSVIKLQDVVYKNLMHGEYNLPLNKGGMGWFGEQVVVNEKDEVLEFNRRLLIGATSLTVHTIVNTIHSLGGLVVASHIDRDAFGIISHLGFIPPDLKFDALEISPNMPVEEAKEKFKEYSHIPWILSSDAHSLEDIGKRTTIFFIEEPTMSEIASALKNIDGKKTAWG